MRKINEINKKTDCHYLNFYELDAVDTKGIPIDYCIASRARTVEGLKINTRNNHPDGVLIYSVYGKEKDRIVLVRQYRYSIDDYIYEFPAGLVEEGEELTEAALREMREETGLTFHPIDVDPMYQKPYYTTIGMTDECCGTVYGYASGVPSTAGLEDSEELEIVLADRMEVRRILREEKVAIMCAYMLMHFIESEGDPLYFLERK